MNERVSLQDDLSSAVRLARERNAPVPVAVQRPLAGVDPAAWLGRRREDSRYYWRSRDGGVEIAGAGVAYRTDADGRASRVDAAARLAQRTGNGLRFFVAGRFAGPPGCDGVWRDFPEDLCLVPEISVVRDGGRLFKLLAVTATPRSRPEQLAADIGRLDRLAADPDAGTPDCLIAEPEAVSHVPGRTRWRRGVEQSLHRIGLGALDKVVLARRTDYTFASPPDPVQLMILLRRVHGGCYTFLAQTRPGSAFISVTPERLYRRSGGEIRIDALSSTTARGKNPAEDERLEHSLRRDPKENLEHGYVVDGISRAVEPLCATKPRAGETSVLKLSRIQHLMTPVSGRLAPGTTHGRLLAALHPTPAVGGSPRAAALETIERIEPFDRGWYAGPAGIVSGGVTELAVAIRSVLVRGRTVSVFAGAGIVAGSDPEAEWRELESKNVLTPLLNGQVTR